MFKYECEHFQVCGKGVEIVEIMLFLVQSELKCIKIPVKPKDNW